MSKGRACRVRSPEEGGGRGGEAGAQAPETRGAKKHATFVPVEGLRKEAISHREADDEHNQASKIVSNDRGRR